MSGSGREFSQGRPLIFAQNWCLAFWNASSPAEASQLRTASCPNIHFLVKTIFRHGTHPILAQNSFSHEGTLSCKHNPNVKGEKRNTVTHYLWKNLSGKKIQSLLKLHIPKISFFYVHKIILARVLKSTTKEISLTFKWNLTIHRF